MNFPFDIQSMIAGAAVLFIILGVIYLLTRRKKSRITLEEIKTLIEEIDKDIFNADKKLRKLYKVFEEIEGGS